MRKLAITPQDKHLGPLILVNREHPVNTPALERSLRLLSINEQQEEVLLDTRAAGTLASLLHTLSGRADIIPISGYRSAAEQQSIYSDSLAANGDEFTNCFVAPPDCSEHQTGLAVDLAENRPPIDFLCPSFPDSGPCGRFRQRASKYGFILRYAADKQQLTRISYEPWHFRYVGYPHSQLMENRNLCLEEYTAFLRGFPYWEQHLQVVDSAWEINIFFIPVEDYTELSLPDNSYFQLSGNNVDGCVGTLWRRRAYA